jgi:predicted unusual protein kinase regulating ubiquinone biosynthesis (AarF/ABC1/UbiB family)
MLVEWFFELFLPRIGLGRLARKGRDARFLRIARSFHDLAVDLGGLMIKVGQFMSTRMDVLPTAITDELAGLQDEVAPVPFDGIRAQLRSELGADVEDVFADFRAEPMASASLGQAHRARLRRPPTDGADAADRTAGTDSVVAPDDARDVVVKVQRPGIEDVVEVDLAALRKVAGWLSHVRVISSRVDLPAIVGEFATTSYEEVDYLHEADSAERFRQNMGEDPQVLVPRVVRAHTTRRVLVETDVSGIKLTDTAALRAAGIDPAEVAQVFATTMFDQFFLDGFFHADPHPGNLYVRPTPGGGQPWQLVYIDFGMMGEVTDTLRGGMKDLVLAVGGRDSAAIVQAMHDLGVLLPSTQDATLEHAMSDVFARFGGMDVSELQDLDPEDFSDFARDFGEVMRSMPFQLPEDFLLLFRALSLLDGLCTRLDPHFNIWEVVQPYAQRLVRDEAGGAVQDVVKKAGSTLRTAATLPGRIDEVVTLAERGQLPVRTPGAERELRRLTRTVRGLGAAGVFAALFTGGLLLRMSEPGWAIACLCGSAVAFVLALVGLLGGRRGIPPHRR